MLALAALQKEMTLPVDKMRIEALRVAIEEVKLSLSHDPMATPILSAISPYPSYIHPTPPWSWYPLPHPLTQGEGAGLGRDLLREANAKREAVVRRRDAVVAQLEHLLAMPQIDAVAMREAIAHADQLGVSERVAEAKLRLRESKGRGASRSRQVVAPRRLGAPLQLTPAPPLAPAPALRLV